MSSSWIVSSARTPIGKYLGELSHYSAPQLAGFAIAAAVDRLKKQGNASSFSFDEVVLGHVLGAGVGQAPTRQAALFGGIADTVGCASVNKVCGSGMYSVMLADRAIRCGDHQCVIAGGMESMSQVPHLLRGGRGGWKYGSQPLLDAIEFDGLTCPHGAVLMGKYAEQIAADYGVTRQMQDEWACQSHQRAVMAQQSGQFADEIVPVTGLKGDSIVIDGGPRADSSLERLAKLRPVFDATGTVTAGNSSSLSDGAAAVVVASASLVKLWQPKMAFRIVGTTVHAAEPGNLFIAPVGAISRLLDQSGYLVKDIDLFEINEAFASQTIACRNVLGIDPDKLNIHGGAIALGHPIGCSGTRVLVSLMHALVKTQKRLGIASLCLGGGEAVAMLIEASS